MRSSMFWVGALVALGLLACLAPRARADGMTFRVVGADADVRATAQRAVLWLREGTWELHIQPVFERGAGAAAWVVPFPVRPTVAEGNPDFLDQLEVATSPVFLRLCAEGSSSCLGCGAADLGGGQVLDGDAFVQVWERGQVGGLEYVILSAHSGQDLVGWLDAEGFEVPTEAGAVLGELDVEGSFFFAARLGATLDPAVPLTPVRFVLPGLDPPSYPLRLTAAVVPAGQSLELTLWVISPPGQVWLPDGRALAQPPGELADRASLDAALDAIFDAHPDGLAVLHFATLTETGAFEGQVCSWLTSCLSYAEVGLSLPATWAPEMEALRVPGDHVARYQARLGAAGMLEDLRLRPLATNEYWYADRVYKHFTCHQEGATGALLALLSLGAALRLRRRA